MAVVVIGVLPLGVRFERGGKEGDLGKFLGVLLRFDPKERGSDEGDVCAWGVRGTWNKNVKR